MTFLIEMIAVGGVDGSELLQTSHPPEAKRRPFWSSQWDARILDPAVRPAACLLTVGVTDHLHCGTV